MTLSELQQTLASLAPPGAIFANLTTRGLSSCPELAPRRPASSELVSAIQSITGSTARQTSLLQAGLFLMHDFLDESHRLSQSREGDPDADLWHAIMHRREPDYFNSKYWYRHVGQHPIFTQLAQQATPILVQAGADGLIPAAWNAFLFVDICQRVEQETSTLNDAARQVQWIEMSLHLTHCCEVQ